MTDLEVQEYVIFKGDEPYDEENQFFIPVSEMKTAMKARDVMIEQKIKDKKEGKRSTPSASTPKSKGLGNRESKITKEVVDEDCPFSTDDEAY
jgi:hypothetical protein